MAMTQTGHCRPVADYHLRLSDVLSVRRDGRWRSGYDECSHHPALYDRRRRPDHGCGSCRSSWRRAVYVTYTNSDGVAGRVTATMTCNTQTVNGTIANQCANNGRHGGPFIPLQKGDSGVRSIEAFTFLSG